MHRDTFAGPKGKEATKPTGLVKGVYSTRTVQGYWAIVSPGYQDDESEYPFETGVRMKNFKEARHASKFE